MIRYVALWALAGMLANSHLLAAAPDGTSRKMIEADWIRQEKVTRRQAAASMPAVDAAIERGRRMIADMRELGASDAAAAATKTLQIVSRKRDILRQASTPAGHAWLKLYLQTRWAIRKLAFSNPHLDFDQLLFVERQWPRHRHQCSHRVGEAQTPGANLVVLKGLRPDGQVRKLLTGEFAAGGIGRPDLSFDAKRVVFSYAAPRRTGDMKYGRIPGHRGGRCVMYDIMEVDVAGGVPRRLTHNPKSEDTEPCYLPDGRIAFMSSRAGRFVQCGDWALACGLYSIKPDGSDIRQITEPKEGEFYPSVLEDGRIMYTRWDYMMKGYNVIQQLWAVNPDGTRAQLVYGDHYRFSHGPITFFEAHQIPGTSKVICTGAAHHNTGVGPIMIVDLARNRGGADSMRNVTPEVGYPEMNDRILNETGSMATRNMSTRHSPTGWYSSPWPLTENHFLVSYSFEFNDNVANGYGLYLQDVHGNKELIYRSEHGSCYAPVPLRARAKPAVLRDLVNTVRQTGTLFVEDIYQGLHGVKHGEVKYLRVLETYPKTIRTTPQRVDVGVNSGWDMRGVLGTVPVEADGSAHFEVPADRQLFFEALDENYLELRRMRNFMSVKPGEVTSCVGCHERYDASPVSRTNVRTVAMRRGASTITPPPWGGGAMSFVKVIQPILDRKCVSCHDGADGPDKSFDLRGRTMVEAPTGYDRDAGPQHSVSDSFLKLLGYVSYIRVGGYQGEKLPLEAGATGSRKSKLMALLKAGHQGVKLDQSEWRAFAAWIDCNAPFYGSWNEVTYKTTHHQPQRGGVSVLRNPNAADKQQIAERIRQLQQDHSRTELAAYLNCGVQKVSGHKGIVITQTRGRGWNYCDTSTVKGLLATHADITFDNEILIFKIKGLTAGKRYSLEMTWWDFNDVDRRQSVWFEGRNGKPIRLHPPTLLPGYARRKQMPGRASLDLLATDIEMKVSVRRNGGANAVLSEIWIRNSSKQADTRNKDER